MFHISDENGNKIVGLEVLLDSLRKSGLSIGRFHTNDNDEIIQMLTDKLSFDLQQIEGCVPGASLKELSSLIVDKSLPMPKEIINAVGYTLAEKVKDCNLYYVHALTQVLQLAEKDSEHFGKKRTDIAERVKEIIHVDEEKIEEPLFPEGELDFTESNKAFQAEIVTKHYAPKT